MSERVPEESVADDFHRSARAALSAIPVVGGAAIELFNRLLAPPIQRRRDAWLNGLAERINKLEQEGRVKVEDLQNNDEFVSTVMQASQVAVRNHQREKVDALRNAVLNTAIGQAPDDSKREMFLGLVDTFTVWHLRLLALFTDPPKWFERNGKPVPQFGITSSRHAIIQKAFPDASAQGEWLQLVITQLHDQKLIGFDSIMTMLSATGALERATTGLSDEFISFISEPQPREKS